MNRCRLMAIQACLPCGLLLTAGSLFPMPVAHALRADQPHELAADVTVVTVVTWNGKSVDFPTKAVWTSWTLRERGANHLVGVAKGRDAQGPVEFVIAQRDGFYCSSLQTGTGTRWSAEGESGKPILFQLTASSSDSTGCTGTHDFSAQFMTALQSAQPHQPEEGGVAGGCVDADTVDILVVYKPCALALVGGLGPFYSRVTLAEELVNLAFANSGIDEAVRVVAVQPTIDWPCDLLPFDVDLTSVTDPNTDLGGPVSQMREYFKADVVVFAREPGASDQGGLSVRRTELNGCDGALGYCVVNIGTLGTSFALTHQLGHLFGCCHAPGDGGAYCPIQPWFYSNGHRFLGLDFVLYGTIMTASPATVINHFSNPDVSYEGEPTGTSTAIGGRSSDNARVIREMFASVRCYRCADIGGGGGGGPSTEPDPGPVICWGSNSVGQRTPPTDLGDCFQIAAGYTHSIAIQSLVSPPPDGPHGGPCAAWGSNDHGKSTIPLDLGECIRVAAGDQHTLAIQRLVPLASSGPVRAWGAGWPNAPFSPPHYGQSIVPVDLGNCTEIAAGRYHSLALRDDGVVRGWGHNTFGQSDPPADLAVCTKVSAGMYHSVALEVDGTIRAWGLAGNGQTAVPPGLGVCTEIAAGGWHTVALTQAGLVEAWGLNNYGQRTVSPTLGVCHRIAAGAYHTVAITGIDQSAPAKTIVAFGAGTVATGSSPHYGQSIVPLDIEGPWQIAAGGFHTIATATLVPVSQLADCAGDLNADGRIDGIDLNVLLAGWGTAMGDCSGDGQTDGRDLTFQLARWGKCN